MPSTHQSCLYHWETCETCRKAIASRAAAQRARQQSGQMTPEDRRARAVNAAAVRDARLGRLQKTQRAAALARIAARAEPTPTTGAPSVRRPGESPFDYRARLRREAEAREREYAARQWED